MIGTAGRTRRDILLAAALSAAVGPLAAGGAAEAETLRTNIVSDPAMVDPITFSELVAGDILENVYEGLTGIDPEGEVVPALAT